jgi:hypothetical protein
MNSTDGARRVVADAKWRREKPNSHRQNDNCAPHISIVASKILNKDVSIVLVFPKAIQ